MKKRQIAYVVDRLNARATGEDSTVAYYLSGADWDEIRVDNDTVWCSEFDPDFEDEFALLRYIEVHLEKKAWRLLELAGKES